MPEPAVHSSGAAGSTPTGVGADRAGDRGPGMVHALTLRIDPGVESMIPTGRSDLDALRTFHARFGSDEVVVLALHSDRLFSPESLERIDRLTQRVRALPHVAQVLSPTNVRDLDGDELGPVPVVPYQQVQAGKLKPEAMGTRLGSHPIFGGLLVSKDARTAAVLVELEESTGPADSHRDLVANLRRLASEAGPDTTAFVAGIPVEKVEVATYIARDQKIFVPLVFLILAVMTAVLYRHPVGMLVPLAVLTLALVWALGLFGLTGRSLNPVTSLMTPVILVMSLEAAIQLLNQYLAARARGLARLAALEQADRRMRIPCFNAALTAAIGFLSLLVLPIPAIRDFGLFTAVGIMLGYALTIVADAAPARVAARFSAPGRSRIRAGARRTGAVAGGAMGVRPPVRRPGSASARSSSCRSWASPGSGSRRTSSARSVTPARSRRPRGSSTSTDRRELRRDHRRRRCRSPTPRHLEKVARFEDAVRGLPDVRKVTGLPDVSRGSTAPCTEATTRMRISRTGRTRRPTSRTISPG